MPEMSGIAQQAELEAARLLPLDEEDLYAQLGGAAAYLTREASKGGAYDLHVSLTAVPKAGDGGRGDWLAEYGRGLFRRMQTAAHRLICASDELAKEDRDKLLNALGRDVSAVGVLTAIFVAYLGLSVGVATVIAVLVVKLFLQPALDQLCEQWTAALENA